MLDKIDAYQHEKELEVQEKLKASERKLEKAKKAGNAEDEEKYKGKIAKFQKKLDEMHVGAGNWQEVDAKGHVRFVQLPTAALLFTGLATRAAASWAQRVIRGEVDPSRIMDRSVSAAATDSD